MLRKFTKDVGRFKEGQLGNYPKDIWEKIAQDYVRTHSKLRLKTRDVDTEKVLARFSTRIHEDSKDNADNHVVPIRSRMRARAMAAAAR
jgi:hypothetical protein